MASKEAALEAAAFADSAQCAVPPGVERADARAIVERFADCAFRELGKAPRFLDADDLHTILAHLLPARFGKKDALAKSVVPTLLAYFDFLKKRAIISQSYEIRRALEENTGLFLRVVETGETHVHDPSDEARQRPFVNKAEKVGRNDPCPCGSGKKFKQCCMKIGL